MSKIIIILISTCLFFSFVYGQEIEFEHVIIDNDGIGHRVVGDIDGDGFNDIVALNAPADERQSADILVFYKYPDWKKYKMVIISEFKDYNKYRSCDMELADIDADGDLDILGRIGKPGDHNEGVNVWFENPKPKGDPAKDRWKRHDIGRSYYVKDIEAADFNGDGMLDVAVRAENAKLHVFFQSAQDSWKEIVIDAVHHDGMDVGDMDRDGDLDIVLNGFWLEAPKSPLIDKWEKHDFDSKWYTQKTGEKGVWYDNNSKVKLADMNRDGCLDIIISHSENKGFPVSWYEAPFNPKSDDWKEHIIENIDYCHSLNAADIDNDGDIDIMAGEMPRYDAPYPVVIFINQGDALKWSSQELSNKGSYSATIGDIDNDGDIDIIGLRCFDKPPIEMWRNKTKDN